VELNCKLKENFVQKTGIKLIECYGLTEASPAVLCNPLNSNSKIDSVGIPLQSTEVKVIDPNSGTQCNPGYEGELQIRGPQVMKGYWKNSKETTNILKNGWLCTGDKVKTDDDGFIYITGRYKNMFINSGFNIFPEEVENVIKMHPLVSEVKLTGTKDCRFGDVLNAEITLKNSFTMKEKEMRDFCKKYLAGYKIPKHFKIIQTVT
jgi:long-chain acyl-CoA synthetase